MTYDCPAPRNRLDATAPVARTLVNVGIYLSEVVPLPCGCRVHCVLWEADLIWRRAETLQACAVHGRIRTAPRRPR